MMIDWLADAGLPGSAIKWPAWITVVAAINGALEMAASNAAAISLAIIGKFIPSLFSKT
jgi:hypothetical protein